MSQILHIFKKDTRRFWGEILLSIGVTMAYALILPHQWRMEEQVVRVRFQPLIVALSVLIPASWWLLIGRVVQAESLVGDTQFWITRPYAWTKLLAAKILFLALWLGVPFVLAQFIVLAEAGFSLLHYLPVVLVDLLFVSVIALLPLVAIATITANFARMTLTLLGGFVVILLMAFASMSVVLRNYSAYNPLQDWATLRLSMPSDALGCAAVILLMYATRRAWTARGLGVVLVLLLFGLMVVYRGQLLVNRAYAASGSAANPVVRVALTTDADLHIVTSMGGDMVYLNLPMRYSDVADGYMVSVENVKFSLTAADGSHWISPWQEMREENLSGARGSLLSLKMSTKVFDRFASGLVTLHLTFAETRTQADTVTLMPYPTGDVAVPGLGICYSWGGSQVLACRQMLLRARLAYVTIPLTSVVCGDSATGPGTTVVRGAWTGELTPSADLAINPIRASNVRIPMNEQGPDGQRPDWHICPGALMTVTQYHLVDRGQLEMTLANFQMPPVAVARE
jgi:hypothetical protein